MMGWFVETTVVASGLAVVAALASRFRSIGPTARHLLWLVVMLKLVTPPLLSWPWAVDWVHESQRIALPAPTAPPRSVAVADSTDSPLSPADESITSTAVDEPVTAISLVTDDDEVRTVAEVVLPELVIPEAEMPQVATPELMIRREEAKADSGDANSALLVRLSLAYNTAVEAGQISRIADGMGRGWLLVTALLALAQAWRIIRFRDRLQSAVPGPDDLLDEAERIAGCFGVPVPELLVVSQLHTPLVWCLGRPKLLLPAHLVKTLGLDQWRAILIHELAHIRRGDHWASRLELVAGVIWWWNPLYWLARNRLDAEAELACDAWVVSFLPKDRLAYAEALFDIFSTLSKVRAPAPALGAAGSGQLIERRLTMILHDQVSCRLSPLALLCACFLVLFALPSWSTATPAARTSGQSLINAQRSTDDPDATVPSDDDDDDDDINDDDDDDDNEDDPDVTKAKANLKKAEETLKKIEAESKKNKKAEKEAKRAEKEAKKAAKQSKKAEADDSDEKANPGFDFSQLADTIEKQITGKFGPDFEKKMEELGERIEKEIESNFGPDFEKRMEALGEKLGKDMEAKLGEGSDFEKAMKNLGKDLEASLGSGSEFEKKMKEMSKELEEKLGPGSEFEKKIKQAADRVAAELEKAAKQSADSPGDSKTGDGKTTKAPAPGNDHQRDRQIAALEEQINRLAAELKALKSQRDRK